MHYSRSTRILRTSLAAAGAAALTLTLVSCSGGEEAAGDAPLIGVILPDSASSDRWETADRAYLKAAFEKAGVDYDIQNAQGSKDDFQTIVIRAGP